MTSISKFWVLILFVHFNCWSVDLCFPSQWEEFNDMNNAIVVASPGRSGSTLLFQAVSNCVKNRLVIKTHLLVPEEFQGKILFIYSNPDLATESALYRIYHEHPGWVHEHFIHVFTADKEWINTLKGNYKSQTLDNNLLCYDALGIEAHLRIWLHEYTKPSNLMNANILAIKYEHLWDVETKFAIMQFLNTNALTLPVQKQRGRSIIDLTPREASFKEAYNLGTPEHPIYAAYDGAREIWENSPPFQFLQFRSQ